MSRFNRFWILAALSASAVVIISCGPEATAVRSEPRGLPNPIPVVVWIDEDLDGEPGGAEPPLAGVVVRLINPQRNDEIVDEAVTGANGAAELVGLQDLIASYVVALVVPDGYALTTGETFSLEGHDYRAEKVEFCLVERAGY